MHARFLHAESKLTLGARPQNLRLKLLSTVSSENASTIASLCRLMRCHLKRRLFCTLLFHVAKSNISRYSLSKQAFHLTSKVVSQRPDCDITARLQSPDRGEV